MTANINSLLVADIGSVHTRLVLIDLVEGQYRLIASSRARTTAEPPLNSVNLGLDHAAQNMTALVERNFVDVTSDQLILTPESDGHGVDAFLATSSAGRPMRVFMVGLTPEISLASGSRVLAGSYVTLLDVLHPSDMRSEEEKINAILNNDPDLILIVGGTDDGASDVLLRQVETVAMALSLIRQGTMPRVLYAGNPALRSAVKKFLGEYTHVFIAKNVCPTLDEEQLFAAQIELALVYDDYRSQSPGGFAEVGRQSKVGVVPTSQGYISAMRYLSQLPHPGLGPLCIDVGSVNSIIVASVKGTPQYRIRSDLGMGHNLASALEAITPERVLGWLPFEIAADDLWDYAYNKQLRPATVPGTAQELYIEQAFAREIVRLMVSEARPAWDAGQGELLPHFQPIIGAGAILTEAQHPGISAMLLLDALQPIGIAELRLDPHNLVSALGIVAYLQPVMTVQALETGGLVNLGTAFCPKGRPRQGQDAMRVQIRQSNDRVINHTIKGGEIWMAPVLPGVITEVIVRLPHGLSIEGKRRIKRRVVAGGAGIIFDARGRPLMMPRLKDRAAHFMAWQDAIIGSVRTGRETDSGVSAETDDLLPDGDDFMPEDTGQTAS